MDGFAKGYLGILSTGIQSLLGQEAFTGPGTANVSAGPLLVRIHVASTWLCSHVHRDIADIRFEQLADIERMTATFALGFQKSEAVDFSDISQSVLECVQRQRGGSSTQFTFAVPAAGVDWFWALAVGASSALPATTPHESNF
eukprot:scaffold35403_cov16-Tisochrysis_lutea.AAC.1